MLKKAVFLDYASIHPDDLDLSKMELLIENWCWRDSTDEEDIKGLIADVDVIVTNKVVLSEDCFSYAKNLKLVCVAATGTNNVDIKAANHLGVPVCNVRAYATPSVVQHVFAMLLALSTKLQAYQSDVFNGRWSNSEFFGLLDYPVRELSGLTLGIVGYGELGQAVANVAKAFGMKVLIAKRNVDDDREERVALHALLPKVDVLSLHCPLTESTKGLIGGEELALMKTDAVLINTARGGLVDELALLDALQGGRLGGAAFDVLEQEPPAATNPFIQTPLDNLIITPHSAWASRQARQRLVDEIAKNIVAYSKGEKRNAVNMIE